MLLTFALYPDVVSLTVEMPLRLGGPIPFAFCRFFVFDFYMLVLAFPFVQVRFRLRRSRAYSRR